MFVQNFQSYPLHFFFNGSEFYFKANEIKEVPDYLRNHYPDSLIEVVPIPKKIIEQSTHTHVHVQPPISIQPPQDIETRNLILEKTPDVIEEKVTYMEDKSNRKGGRPKGAKNKTKHGR